MKHQGLDHLAIVVRDTEEALKLWHGQLKFPIVHSECVNNHSIRLTHLDLGNTQLQLVEPLEPDHPLQSWLDEHGPGLHHFCLKVEGVSEAMQHSPLKISASPHQGIQGKSAVFVDPDQTQGIMLELTGQA